MTTTFQLDTSGQVSLNAWAAKRLRPGVPSKVFAWTDLSPFVQGYVEALFADGPFLAVNRDSGEEYLSVGFSDLAAETLARIMKDCLPWSKQDVAEAGRRLWADRQKGWKGNRYPPLTVALNDAGKVVFL